MQKAVEDHDCNLLNLLKSASSANLKLNKKKLRLPLSQVTYMGQLFTYEGLRPNSITIELTTLETDHKPFLPIFQKSLHSAPKRLQTMLLRLQRYNFHGEFPPGSQMCIADIC